MADFCDFLYTQGDLHFKSDSGRVTLAIDGVDLSTLRAQPVCTLLSSLVRL
jgi:tRNA threonylcarbamoyladenosine modification (KEOPS) complex  Pcc1 subunit